VKIILPDNPYCHLQDPNLLSHAFSQFN